MLRKGVEGEPQRGAPVIPGRRLLKALGEDPKAKLKQLVDEGLTDKAIATRLTGEVNPVTPGAVKKSRLHFEVKKRSRRQSSEVFKAPEPKRISQDQIKFWVKNAAVDAYVRLSPEEIEHLARSFTESQRGVYTMVDILVATGRSRTSTKARIKGKALVNELKLGNNGKLSMQEGIAVAVRLRVMPQRLPSYQPSGRKPRQEGKRRGRPPGSRNYDGFNSGAGRDWD